MSNAKWHLNMLTSKQSGERMTTPVLDPERLTWLISQNHKLNGKRRDNTIKFLSFQYHKFTQRRAYPSFLRQQITITQPRITKHQEEISYQTCIPCSYPLFFLTNDGFGCTVNVRERENMSEDLRSNHTVLTCNPCQFEDMQCAY